MKRRARLLLTAGVKITLLLQLLLLPVTKQRVKITKNLFSKEKQMLF
jgi:hypothetical protein